MPRRLVPICVFVATLACSPGARGGSHIHFTEDSQDHGRQWAPTLFFSDDSLVTERQHRQSAEAGEFGGVRKISAVDGIQRVEVKIRLKEKADF